MDKIRDIEAKIEKAKRQLKSAGAEDEKKFAERKIEKLNKELAVAKKEEQSKKPTSDKTPLKNREPKGKSLSKNKLAAKKSRMPVIYKGKEYFENDKDYCNILIKIMDEKRAKANKTAQKYRAKSPSAKIGSDVADSVVKAVQVVSRKAAHLSPKQSATFMARIKILEKNADSFLGSFKGILTSDYDAEEIKKPLKEISSSIQELKNTLKKYSNKK